MENNFYWCDTCTMSMPKLYCTICGKKTDMYESSFECLMNIAPMISGCKTKEELIRYIVCDGEPADESCVGHKVYLDNGYRFMESITDILKEIDIVGDGVPEYGGENGYYYEFAKKIPGYDYSRGVGK